jgi:hypothetical protein
LKGVLKGVRFETHLPLGKRGKATTMVEEEGGEKEASVVVKEEGGEKKSSVVEEEGEKKDA